MSESINRLREWAFERCRFATARKEKEKPVFDETSIDIGGKAARKAKGRFITIKNE